MASASLSILAAEQAASSQALEKVTLKLKWFHQFQFAGYYAAQKQGYFQEEGLDVDIQERDFHENTIQQVIDGDVDYSISDSVLLLYQAKGHPVVIVTPIFQHSPQVLYTLASSGISSPYALKNKKMGFYNKDADGFSVLAMLEQAGVNPTVQRTLKTDINMLVRGEVDAVAGYSTNEAYFFRQQGVEVNIINPMHYGIDTYGDMLFTSQKELKQHPERVAKMRRATLRGWQYAMQHQQEMAQYILEHYSPAKNLQHLMFEARAIEEVMALHTTPIGTLDEGRLQFIAELFRRQGLIKNSLDLSNGIYRPSQNAWSFTAQEKAWLKAHPVIRVGVDRAYAPLEFIDEQGHYQGLANDIFKVIQQQTGSRFQPALELNWSQTLQAIQAKQLDVLSAVISSEERQGYLTFTSPYFKAPMVIAAREGSSYIANFSQIEGKRIAVVKDYAAHDKMQKFYPKQPLILVSSIEAGLAAVASGQAYGYIDNVAVIGHYIKHSGLTNLHIAGELPFSADIAIAVRKDWPILHSISQKVLQQIPAKQKAEMTNHWLQVTYQKRYNWGQVFAIVTPILLILIVVMVYNRKLKQAHADLQKVNMALSVLSVTDHLTGVYNRQFLDQRLEEEVARITRHPAPLSLVMMDLDHFKSVNDDYGHLVGDQVLTQVTQVVQNRVRKTDVFGRWGGEEFILICPDTDLSQAKLLAEKIRTAVEEETYPEQIHQTISLGVTQFQRNEPMSQLVNRADEYMYHAKQQGRNQVYAGEATDGGQA